MIEQPLITSGQGPKPKTIDDYSIDLLINRLNQITNNHKGNERKGKYGEALLKCALENYLWSIRTNDYEVKYNYPRNIQYGIDVRFKIKKIVVYIEAKNWNSYPIKDSTFKTEILDRFKHAKEPNSIKIFLINRKSIGLSWIWDLCRGYDLYMIPVESLFLQHSIKRKIVENRATKLFWDIDAIMRSEAQFSPKLDSSVFSELNKLMRKDAVRIALKSKIPINQIVDNLGYNRHSLYRIRSELIKAGETK
ncbi:MAG: hypothetical protein KGY50_03190 [Candidatus Thermoplasmatota archaeon]|nr:hypothetical protein [Candidatus Thermoplasmatota archaeon]